MKNSLLCVVLFLIFTLPAFSQNEIELKVGDVYRFTSPQVATISKQRLTTSAATWDQGSVVEILYNARVIIQFADDVKVIYTYLLWNGAGTTIQQANFQKYNQNNPTFSLPVADFKKLTAPVYKEFKGANVGIYTVPFRLRGKKDKFDFESSLALQANLVFGFGSQYQPDSWFDASVGLGLSSINLNSSNSIVTEDRTASALTVSLGTLFKLNRFANLGVFVGWDFLNSRDRPVQWAYNKKTWVGLGINISFNELTTGITSTEKSQSGN